MRDVMAPQITIYTTASCPYCLRAKSLLARKGVEYKEVPIDGDAAARAAMMARAGGRTSVPQIFIADTHVGGCDDLFALDHAGKLNPLLALAS